MYNIYGHALTAVLYKHVLCPIKISLLTIGMDAFIGHHEFLIFSLILYIYYIRSRSVAISFLKLQHWKVQSNARVFCFQRAKAALARVVTNEEHSNEFWLAQSCVDAKWNFTLYGSLGVVWKTKKLASRTFIHDRHVFKAHVFRFSQRTVKMQTILYSKWFVKVLFHD